MIELPNTIRKLADGAELSETMLGETTSRVFRVGDRFYLKVLPTGSDEPLHHDVDVLAWLSGKLPVPEVVHYETYDGAEYLLITRIEGAPACELDLDPARVARAYGEALRAFHESLDSTSCPFDERIDARIARATERVAEGLIDIDDFDEERLGWSATDVLELVNSSRPSEESTLSVTHGDYCAPNVLFDNNLALTGYIDIGRCGIADIHRDLGIGSRSVKRNFGEDCVKVFYEAYGITPEPELIEYYKLLDELF